MKTVLRTLFVVIALAAVAGCTTLCRLPLVPSLPGVACPSPLPTPAK